VYPPQSRPQTSSPDSRTLASPPDPLYQVVELCAYSLNFGARASPLVFTKHMRTLVKYLRRHAIGVVIYLDDLAFVIEGSQEAAHRARDFIDRTITKAGLHRHPTKGQFLLASQVLHDHLGFRVDIPANLLSIPERRCNKVRQLAIALMCNSARNRRLVDTKLLQQFCGVACSMTRAVPAARLHLRSLYDCTSLHRPCSRLNRTALQDLTFWTQITGTHPDHGGPVSNVRPLVRAGASPPADQVPQPSRPSAASVLPPLPAPLVGSPAHLLPDDWGLEDEGRDCLWDEDPWCDGPPSLCPPFPEPPALPGV